MHLLSRVVALAILLLVPARATAQEPAPGERVRVFVDCQSNDCDVREFRTEITFVDWVVDPAVSDVHVIFTSQDTGAGTEYVFDFLGQGAFAGTEMRLTHAALDTDTRDEVLRSLTGVLGAGLAPFVARRGYADLLRIGEAEREGDDDPSAAALADDRWNLWVFRVGGGFDAQGEEREQTQQFNAEISANRTTPTWRIDFEVEGDFYRREVELNDGRIFVNNTDEWDMDALVVRSVAGRWSAGSEISASTSTEFNRDLGARSALALEWSLFPYEEANRRQFVVHYQLGVQQLQYEEVTIFGKLDERLGDQRIAMAFDARQPWGNASLSAAYGHLLNDLSKYRLATEGRLNFRVFRGLELEVDAGYELLRDQIYLPAGGLTDEEILVQRRQLATGHEYEIGVGFSYQFGSIFNNVVNNRFPQAVREF